METLTDSLPDIDPLRVAPAAAENRYIAPALDFAAVVAAGE